MVKNIKIVYVTFLFFKGTLILYLKANCSSSARSSGYVSFWFSSVDAENAGCTDISKENSTSDLNMIFFFLIY